eukprot:TRINITY_DN10691_c0_g1_i1.p1 TRINITY_DN10691_c0_g1~~TRINITY_DN10691_c0_g1_i1.p1  ORF type:complete len:347 (+),score=54.40 TRINITY_DN10691_c0_g1_i1:14-1054(+)
MDLGATPPAPQLPLTPRHPSAKQAFRRVYDGIRFLNAFHTLRDMVPDHGTLNWNDLQLIDKLGEGAYAEVYSAMFHGCIVAVKKLKVESINQQVLKDFDLEVGVLRKLHHRNIVHFVGVGHTPYEFLVEEYMKDTLSEVITHKHIPPATCFRYAHDIALGMQYLHNSIPCVIHRDLKTSNLLVSPDDVIKICDFGLAKLKRTTDLSNDCYRMTPETGSYYYMGSEVYLHKPYSAKVDVYSYGMCVWEIFAGRLVFHDLWPKDAAEQTSRHGLRPPLPEEWPLALRDLLSRCWHQDHKQRPTFDDIVMELEAIALEYSRVQSGSARSTGDAGSVSHRARDSKKCAVM